MKKQNLLAAILLTFTSSQAFAAQSMVCKNGKDERKIEVSSDTAPCEVKYYKADDATGKVIFSAQSDGNYCAVKASEFAKKLGTIGFTCDGDAAAAKTETKTESKTENQMETKSDAPKPSVSPTAAPTVPAKK